MWWTLHKHVVSWTPGGLSKSLLLRSRLLDSSLDENGLAQARTTKATEGDKVEHHVNYDMLMGKLSCWRNAFGLFSSSIKLESVPFSCDKPLSTKYKALRTAFSWPMR
jgi:hypothetical protein